MFGMPGQFEQGFFADFTNNVYTTSKYATVYTRAHQYDSYIQDEWHVTKDLVLNAGVRWEYNPPPFDAKNSFVPNNPVDGSQGPVTFVKADGWYNNSNLGSVGPRVGIAWSPDNKTAIRAGYAWLFDTISTFQATAIAGKVPGFALECVTNLKTGGAIASTSAGCVAPSGTATTISGGFPVTGPAPSATPQAALSQPNQLNGAAPNVGAFDPNLKNPSVHEWDLMVQREIPWRIVAEAGYVGKRGTHLYRAYDINQININPAFLASFNIARANQLAGCNPDGSAKGTCTGGPGPTLLIQMLGGAVSAASFMGSSSSTSDFRFGDVGDFATRIDQNFNVSANGFPANYFRPNAQFTQIFYQDSGGDSYYHGLFVVLRRRFEKGVDFGMSYTWSKSIDDQSVDPTGASTSGGLSTTNSRTPTDVHNFRLDRSLSDFNNTHVLLANLLYELSFGRGRSFLNDLPSYLNHVIGGWSFGGIFNFQSGEPYTITSGTRTVNGAHVSSAQVVGPLDQGSLLYVQGGTPVMYTIGPLISDPTDPHFNCRNVNGGQTFFCIPPPGQNGAGRNFVRGPSFWNLDSSLTKSFTLTERFNLQFRAEFFNIFNHQNFENPRNASSGSPSIRSGSFASVCCSASSLPSSATVIAIGEPNRVIQFGLKLSF
jgi:TonB dependent receptor